MIALLDTTVLSNFTAAGRPELIRQALGEHAATTEAAWSELQRGIALGKLPAQDWSWLPVLSLTEAEHSTCRLFSQQLGAGEASCLAVAAHRKGRVLTDDRDARDLAARWQIAVSGTLGVLVHLVDSGVLSEEDGDALLGLMRQTGYRSPVSSLRGLR